MHSHAKLPEQAGISPAKKKSPRTVNVAIILLSAAICALFHVLSSKRTLQIASDLGLVGLRVISTPVQRTIPGLKCIRIMSRHQTLEGIGAIIQLNQLAVMLASYYNVSLQFADDHNSPHGYDFNDIFSKCNQTAEAHFPKRCILQQYRFRHEFCPRADCDCIAQQYLMFLGSAVRSGCSTVAVTTDGYRRTEFSGCLGNVVQRYLGSSGGRPDWEYDAIHYRMGDLAKRPGGKSFSKVELWLLVRQLCLLSQRDIVVVTEGAPEVPRCGDRVVLGNSSMAHAVQIFQHARHVAVGVSNFAFLLMEAARPWRVVTGAQHALRYEFVQCDKWTLVERTNGATYHFSSKREMVRMLVKNRKLEFEWKFRNRAMFRAVTEAQLNLSVPTRVWTPEMMKPAVLSCRGC